MGGASSLTVFGTPCSRWGVEGLIFGPSVNLLCGVFTACEHPPLTSDTLSSFPITPPTPSAWMSLPHPSCPPCRSLAFNLQHILQDLKAKVLKDTHYIRVAPPPLSPPLLPPAPPVKVQACV